LKSLFYTLIICISILTSCCYNTAENYKTLDLMMTQPDSIWININNGEIKADSIIIGFGEEFGNDLRDYIKNNYPNGYEIVQDHCSQYGLTCTYSHNIIIQNKLLARNRIMFLFIKREDSIWKYYGVNLDPSLLWQY